MLVWQKTGICYLVSSKMIMEDYHTSYILTVVSVAEFCVIFVELDLRPERESQGSGKGSVT